MRGDWPEAIRSFREHLTFFAPVRMGGMWVGHLAWAEFLAGQLEVARRWLEEFIASADPARTSLALPWAVRAVIARASGEHELAAELAQQAVAAAPADPLPAARIRKPPDHGSGRNPAINRSGTRATTRRARPA